MKQNVVVLGGYGYFGKVVSRRLAGLEKINLIVAGRDSNKAAKFAFQIDARYAGIDSQAPDLVDKLRLLNANVVVNLAGPFQGQDYRVAQAAISAGSHYIDIADGREFVVGIASLDQLARKNNLLVVSGASSVPALSSAVIDSYVSKFRSIDKIECGIKSSEKMPGHATISAVLSYCGKRFTYWEQGKWQHVKGWRKLTTHTFSNRLGKVWLSNCNVPDLEIFPAKYAANTVEFYAGVGFTAQQLALWLLSWLVSLKLLKKPAALAPFLYAAGKRFERFGNGDSGMFVKISGLNLKNEYKTKVWELFAYNNHGQNVPCMAAVALVEKLVAGEIQSLGAIPCMGLISLPEYLAELEGFDIEVLCN